MAYAIHDLATTQRMVRDKIEGREWWTIVSTSATDEGQRIAEKAEHAHYAGEANADFEVIQVPTPDGLITVYFARKSRMSRPALQSIIEALGGKIRLIENTDLLYGADARPELIDAFFALVDQRRQNAGYGKRSERT